MDGNETFPASAENAFMLDITEVEIKHQTTVNSKNLCEVGGKKTIKTNVISMHNSRSMVPPKRLNKPLG